MSKTNPKFDYLIVLQGKYAHGWEDLCAVDKNQKNAWQEIRADKKAYQQNEGGCYRIIERREPR